MTPPTTCKAAIGHGNGTFTIEDIGLGRPASDELMVQVRAAGLCHTDHDSLSWGKPIILGHEGAGIVVAKGEAVQDCEIGDAVILNWATPCGRCFQCLEGNQHICENNSPVVAGGNGYTPGHAQLESATWNGKPVERSFNLGTLSEFTIVKASAVVRNPSAKMSFPAASIISCGVMTGYGSAVNAGKVTAGSSVVVLGCGGVGLNIIQGARISGAAVIVAVDLNPQRLDMAMQFGATHKIQAVNSDVGLKTVATQVRSMTGGRGADFAFESTAIPALGTAPLAMIRNAGTAVQASGIEQEITIDMRLFEWDKVYINPLYGKCRPAIDFPKLIQLYEKGDLLLEEMITRTYPLARLQDAFDDMLAGRNAKGVIVFE